MGFPQARERLQNAIFARLGEDAQWTGIDPLVRVRFAERDELATLGDTELMMASLVLRFRRSEVGAPNVGDVVVLDVSGRRLRISGEARMDANGIWAAPVVDAPA